jgi:hypothetical protein
MDMESVKSACVGVMEHLGGGLLYDESDFFAEDAEELRVELREMISFIYSKASALASYLGKLEG